jgi:hypothetical protein
MFHVQNHQIILVILDDDDYQVVVDELKVCDFDEVVI